MSKLGDGPFFHVGMNARRSESQIGFVSTIAAVDPERLMAIEITFLPIVPRVGPLADCQPF